MKKSVKIIGVTVLSLGIIGATGAYASKNRGEDHAEHADKAVWFISHKLELDSNQEQALSALKDQALIAKDAMHGEMGTARDDVRALLNADSFDQGKALELITAKTATIDSVAPDLVIALGNFMDSLDGEQKQEILDFMDSREKGHKRGKWRH